MSLPLLEITHISVLSLLDMHIRICEVVMIYRLYDLGIRSVMSLR